MEISAIIIYLFKKYYFELFDELKYVNDNKKWNDYYGINKGTMGPIDLSQKPDIINIESTEYKSFKRGLNLKVIPY